MSYRRVVIYHKNSNQADLPSFYLTCLGNDTPPTPAKRATFNAPCYHLPPYAFSAQCTQLLPWPGHRSAQTVAHFP
jgi:hypothetical protein